MVNKLIIGISAWASSGKDTLCSFIINHPQLSNFKIKRFALADALKLDINPFLISHCGIDIFNCTHEEKSIARPLLVAYGRAKRMQTGGTYWTSKLSALLEISEFDIGIITDCRYDHYLKDELFWLRSFSNNLLVHIQREGIQPPNEDEALNDPKIRAVADVRLLVPNVQNLNDLSQYYSPAIAAIKNKLNA